MDAPAGLRSCHLPRALEAGVRAALEDWRKNSKVERLWARDPTLWTGRDEASWLGWLDLVEKERERSGELRAFAEEVRREGLTYAVVLGMGGSSLAPWVFARTLGGVAGYPPLRVLDSTDPAQVAWLESKVDLRRTLFIVSSKSGTTLEPLILEEYFLDAVARALGGDAAAAARRFVAITDPGSKLEGLARERGFRRVFSGAPSIGGRYSALSDFGMVPAAVMGVEVDRLLERAARMVGACSSHVPPEANPGVVLGVILGVAAQAGRDKLTFLASPGLEPLGAWIEQLVAESTGKGGKAILPVDGERPAEAEAYGPDRLFVHTHLVGEDDGDREDLLEALERAGHPVIWIEVGSPYDLGREFFRWEFATAVAGSILGIDPFDQPDVEASKAKTRELTAAYERSGALPAETPLVAEEGVTLYAAGAQLQGLGAAGPPATVAGVLRAHLDRLEPGDYFALLAYLEMSEANLERLQAIRHLVRDRKRVATCLGFGPRFLHSTGQAHKGGPATGLFLEVTCDDLRDLAIPGRRLSFGVVKAAQARGDLEVLAERGRRALRAHLGADVRAGLDRLARAVEQALS